MKKVIVITGTPGVGKTTVSKALAVKLGGSIISLTDIVKEENLISEIDDERKTLVADLKKTSKRVREIIDKSEKDIIIEGHYASDVVQSNRVSHAFVLRRDPEELKAEYESRGYNNRKVAENVTAEVLDVCLAETVKKYGVDKVDEIDVSKKSIDDVVDEILKTLEGKRKPQSGTVDWLGRLEEEGRIDNILPLLSKI